MRRMPLIFLMPAFLLAACSAEPAQEDGDAAAGEAGENVVLEDPADDPALAEARARAEQLVGGAGAMRQLGEARTLASTDAVTPAMREAAQAAVSPGGANCAEKVEYTTRWAEQLPNAFPVYPRAETIEAAGTDEGACALRIVTFRSPVPLAEVLAFYNTRALGTGYSSEYVKAGGDDILSGSKGASSFVVYGRSLPSGVTEIDLVTSAR